MNTNDKKINKLFLYWLASSLILVFFIIIIGGLTRLTNSGLSITEWELFKGILPPFNQTSWDFYFEQYKTIPQFKLLNNKMTMDEFKIIFFWEYFHRLLARFIGLFFLLPLLIFYFSKKIPKKYMTTCYKIFILILLQGVVGWYMVKSGLVNDITVSHYRLSIHLTIAIIIISAIFWLLKNVYTNNDKLFFNFSKANLPFLFLIFLIFAQIVLGAFVSGLDAGKIYQTWPLMGYNYFPNDIIDLNLKSFFNFNNHSLVQFYHRSLAYITIVYFLILSFYIYQMNLRNLFKSIKLVFIFLFL